MTPVDISSDLPLPRFRLGDKVFYASAVSERTKFPCPDCKGEKVWKCIAPSGVEGTIACPRCSAYFRPQEIPSLDYLMWKPHVSELTVGQITATASRVYAVDDPISYMCHETGIGSGSVYRESLLCATREEAEERAAQQAAEKNAAEPGKPEMMMAFALKDTVMDFALLAAMQQKVINDWGARRRLMELADTLSREERIKEEGFTDVKEVMEYVQGELDFIRRFYIEKKNDDLLARIEAFLNDLDDQLQWGPDSHSRYATLEEERKALLEALNLIMPKKNDEEESNEAFL
jgi:hypothetical protein